jgi:hypothetical protein
MKSNLKKTYSKHREFHLATGVERKPPSIFPPHRRHFDAVAYGAALEVLG